MSGVKSLFKLEKLKVASFSDSKRIRRTGENITVMFNPESFSITHSNVFERLRGINTSGRSARYSYSESDALELELIFDGTGVADFGAVKALNKIPGIPVMPEALTAGKSVSQQVDDFLKQCFYMDGDIHEPKFLSILWGSGELKQFDCRLKSVKINYSMFDRSGAALRAKVQAVFISDMDPKKRAALANKNSPDLSHMRTVRNGDTLPSLCNEIYGTSAHYLFVARANALDNFSNLQPGTKLRFQPIPN